MMEVQIPEKYLPVLKPNELHPTDIDKIDRPPSLEEILSNKTWVVITSKRELEDITGANILYIDHFHQNPQPTIFIKNKKGRLLNEIDFEDSDLFAMAVTGIVRRLIATYQMARQKYLLIGGAAIKIKEKLNTVYRRLKEK